jgi:hypothetical protein
MELSRPFDCLVFELGVVLGIRKVLETPMTHPTDRGRWIGVSRYMPRTSKPCGLVDHKELSRASIRDQAAFEQQHTTT